MFQRSSSKRTRRSCRGRGTPVGRRQAGLRLESLESRRLLTTVGVDGVDGDDLPLADAYMVSRGDFSVPVTPIHSGTDIATFYDYDTTHSYSSNTGYEASDRITLLLHEDPSADLGLVVLIDHVTDGSGG